MNENESAGFFEATYAGRQRDAQRRHRAKQKALFAEVTAAAERRLAILRAILEADERGQGVGYAGAMEAAAREVHDNVTNR